MSAPPRPAVFRVLLAVLAAEFLLVAAVAATLLVELLVDRPASYPTAIALLVLALIAVAWLGAILGGAWRGRAWIRGAALVWQVLQFAVGIGALRGDFARPEWGWPLVLVAVLGFILLLSRPVVVALARERDGEEDGETP